MHATHLGGVEATKAQHFHHILLFFLLVCLFVFSGSFAVSAIGTLDSFHAFASLANRTLSADTLLFGLAFVLREST